MTVSMNSTPFFRYGHSGLEVLKVTNEHIYTFILKIPEVLHRIHISRIFFGGVRTIPYSELQELPDDLVVKGTHSSFLIMTGCSLAIVLAVMILCVIKARSNGTYSKMIVGGLLALASVIQIICIVRITDIAGSAFAGSVSLGISTVFSILNVSTLGLLTIFVALVKGDVAAQPLKLDEEETLQGNKAKNNHQSNNQQQQPQQNNIYNNTYNNVGYSGNGAYDNMQFAYMRQNGPPGMY
eukprot:GDKJ01012577.1.p1 GENE.GDKJ01012577.1~~GDKJ01012577.1.p1  ORF type:complete len:239 (+),score=54.20 GDKJ01012577.1:3-719(+)